MKVFSKEKYLKRCRELHLPTSGSTWPDKCDGMPVKDGCCVDRDGRSWGVSDSWCINVPETVNCRCAIVKEENTMYTMKDFINKPIAVRVGQDHKIEFLKMCEAEGLKWRHGEKPTQWAPDIFGDKMCITRHCKYGHGDLMVGDVKCYEKQHLTIVDFKDIKPNNEPRYQIIIDCDGKTTTAKMLVDGKEVKTGVAKYNPADKFDFSIGAKVAFDRLWDKPEPVKFKVGDRVKCVRVPDGNKEVVGKYGTVKKVGDGNYLPILVDFDERLKRGHGGLSNAKCKPDHGWWCPVYALELVTIREVKRPAKPGEYIKIVKSSGLTIDEYKTGDILKVVKVNDKMGWAYYKDAIGKYANTWEYVVLEGYVPPVEPEAKFKVGDRVVCTERVGCNDAVVGKRGTVRAIDSDGWSGVEFDEDIGGHGLMSRCKNGHGWWCPPDKLKVEQYKEVKRHAKVGEWVKIVDAKGHTSERYKNGDIKQVTADAFGCGVRFACGGCHCVDSEYVVLEGYNG